MTDSLTLAEHPGDLVRLTCEKCGRGGQYRKAKLAANLITLPCAVIA
jgi:hypothetical protein